jgi:hypothetical protein
MALGLTLFQFATAIMRETRMVGPEGGLTPVQAQIVEYLENAKGEYSKRREACAFRGAGKSTLTAIQVVKWLDDDPNVKILIISASLGRAEQMTTWILSAIQEIEWLAHLRPDTKGGRYSRIGFDVGACEFIEQSPSVRAAGINGQITGSRANKIIVDDCETPTTALTQVQRQKLRNSLNELEAILKPGPDSEVIYLGTPHSATDSIYFALNRDLNYDMRMWPARVPESAGPYRGCLAPLIEQQIGIRTGKATDTRFSDLELRERELSMSVMQWKLQYMLDATLSDIERYPLRCRDLMVMHLDRYVPEVVVYGKGKHSALTDLPCAGMAHDPLYYRPEMTEGQKAIDTIPTVMALDPSGGGKDEFAWSVVKAYNGNYFLTECDGKIGGVDELLWQRIAATAKAHKVNEIIVETNFAGTAQNKQDSIYAQLLKPFLVAINHPCVVTSIRHNKQKELRIIDTIAPVLQTHRLIVNQEVIEKDNNLTRLAKDEQDISYSLIYQMTRLTHDRNSLLHDDKLDSVAMAIAYFVEQAAQDQRKMQSKHDTEYMLAMFEDWKGQVLLTPQRLALGMTLEQAKRAEGRKKGRNWIR